MAGAEHVVAFDTSWIEACSEICKSQSTGNFFSVRLYELVNTSVSIILAVVVSLFIARWLQRRQAKCTILLDMIVRIENVGNQVVDDWNCYVAAPSLPTQQQLTKTTSTLSRSLSGLNKAKEMVKLSPFLNEVTSIEEIEIAFLALKRAATGGKFGMLNHRPTHVETSLVLNTQANLMHLLLAAKLSAWS